MAHQQMLLANPPILPSFLALQGKVAFTTADNIPIHTLLKAKKNVLTFLSVLETMNLLKTLHDIQ